MVTGYNLYLDRDEKGFQNYIDIGKKHLKEQKAKTKDCLREYIKNGIADGTQIEKDWFPQIEADIFLSHSHEDEELALGLAGWLNKTFGLKCFIDSCVWGYADDLLEQINCEFSDKQKNTAGGYTYNHVECITASKHVNTLLTIALHKMIDKAEVTLLLNTQNSISKYEDVYKEATYSPWIYSEIICTQIVRKKKISDYRSGAQLEYFEKSNSGKDGFNAAYGISLDHLKKIERTHLFEWEKYYDIHTVAYPLDCLYKLTYLEETKNIHLDVFHS
ncbi:hypothetical protein [Clostridium sp.]